MASIFKKDDVVEVQVTTPKGAVESIRMDENGMVWYLISWVDSSSEMQHRWFPEDQLTLSQP
jgi:uncharacterized protein YodC (DUF2158 family)